MHTIVGVPPVEAGRDQVAGCRGIDRADCPPEVTRTRIDHLRRRTMTKTGDVDTREIGRVREIRESRWTRPLRPSSIKASFDTSRAVLPMNPVILCETCGHELRLQTDWAGRVLYCPGCRGRLRVPPAPARFPLRGRRLGLILLGVIAVSLPAAFGAATMRWSAAPAPAVPDSASLDAMEQFVQMPSGRDMRSSADLLPLLPPVRIDPRLVIPTGVDSQLEIPAGGASDEGMRLVGRLPAGLAFASEPSRGLLLSAGADSFLHWHDANTLRPVGSCRLPGPAYQLACDGTRGLLYAALSSPDGLKLGPLGDLLFAVGDVHVFDLDRLLALAPNATARAATVIPCEAHVWSTGI